MTITFPTLSLCGLNTHATTELLDDHRALEPPDPIPNSAVKRCIADGSVGFPHVRVGHRQALYRNAPIWKQVGAFLFARGKRRLRPQLALASRGQPHKRLPVPIFLSRSRNLSHNYAGLVTFSFIKPVRRV